MKLLLLFTSVLLVSLGTVLPLPAIMELAGVGSAPEDGASDKMLQPKAPLSIASILEAVRSGTTIDLVEKFAGENISVSNMNKVMADMTAATGDEEKSEPQKSNALNGKETQLLATLQKALKEGKIDSKSSQGNRFRQEVDTTGMSTAQMKEYRMSWATSLAEQLESKKVVVKEWRKVDSTAFTYRPFGKLVTDFGGWSDVEAVKGATTGALQCLAMGEPWVRIHPQTQMVCFAIAEMGWREKFEQAWRSTVTYYTGNDGNTATGSSSSPGLKRAAEEGVSLNVIPAAKVKLTPQCSTKSSKPESDTPRVSPRKDGKDSKEGGKDGVMDEKKKLQLLFREGMKVKVNFTASMGKAEDIDCLT